MEIVIDKNWMDKSHWCPFAQQLIVFTLVDSEETPQAASAVDVVTLDESPTKPASNNSPSGNGKESSAPFVQRPSSEKSADKPPTSEPATSKPNSAVTTNDDGMPDNLREVLTEILASESPQKSQQAVGTDKGKPCELPRLRLCLTSYAHRIRFCLGPILASSPP